MHAGRLPNAAPGARVPRPAGAPLAAPNVVILGLGIAAPAAYLLAFGAGRPQRERQWAVKLFGLLVMLLLAQARPLSSLHVITIIVG